jgi:hypothetical protein
LFTKKTVAAIRPRRIVRSSVARYSEMFESDIVAGLGAGSDDDKSAEYKVYKTSLRTGVDTAAMRCTR